ncbi:helix-turn-helix transcriptional regulator [Cohnella sp. GCM10020058]|uniref:helix-turn-helix transcriptional regulator n=1 Tax=Cohnella sp. GCM10020058 TaxID=3317330 RepID=UPI00362C418B
MKLLSVHKESYIMPGESESVYLPKNISLFLKCQGEAKVFYHKNSSNINNEGILITRTTYKRLKLQALNNIIKIQFYLFLDESQTELNNSFIKINSMGIEIIEMSQNLFTDKLEKDIALFEKFFNTILKKRDMHEKTKLVNKKNQIDTRLIKVNRFIRDNYSKPITLRMLGELININPIYLSNAYSKVFQVSPIYYLNTVRINAAKRILTKNFDFPIYRIAKMVGFSSSSHFAATFKRYTSLSPSEFKNLKT